MPKYLAKADTWISHECRMVKEGTEFETIFPTVGGKKMKLGANLELVKGKNDPVDETESEVDQGQA